jgi:hydrogenase expression/formation protein HypC
MCLAIPSRLVTIENTIGTIDTAGVRREVSLLLLDDVGVGDYVIVHAGYAIQKIDEASAKASLQVLRDALIPGADR